MKIGTYAVEKDYSQYITYSAKTIFAVLGTATKGPIGVATICTSVQDLVDKFGPLNPKCFGLYSAAYFLSQSSKIYFIRVASSNAAAASASITSTGADADRSITIAALEKGDYANNYKVNIEAVTENGKPVAGVYNLIVSNAAGATLEKINKVKLDDMIVGYKTNYIQVTTREAGITTIPSQEITLSGGDNGFSESDASNDMSENYINAANATLLADNIDMNLFATPGVSDISVITAMLSIAESRGDCLYLVDPPAYTTDDINDTASRKKRIIDWHNEADTTTGALRIDSSYGALYYDWVTIYDSYNKMKVDVPPSVVVAATFAQSDKLAELWFAPAGVTRGKVKGVFSVINHISKVEAEELYKENINPLYEDPQAGLVVWGQKTLQRDQTALDRVNVRRLLNYLKRVVTATCNTLTFEPNDRITWNSFKMKVDPILQGIQTKRGIYEYRIVHGESIVTTNDIDNYRMPCMILIRPTKAAEEIPIYFAITSTGADFNEVLDASGLVME